MLEMQSFKLRENDTAQSGGLLHSWRHLPLQDIFRLLLEKVGRAFEWWLPIGEVRGKHQGSSA
eukprot:scaffold300027_cov142-Cyclotella_meneghiniana.AAC.1